MADYLDILAEGISDTGYWRWWDQSFPRSFQIEFGRTQFWNPPEQEGKPPSGIIALRFTGLVSVSFVTHNGSPEDYPRDWPERLHNDSIEPFPIADGWFGFNDPQLVEQMLSEAKEIDTRFGPGPETKTFREAKLSLAFRAGPTGLIVAAQGITMLNIFGEIKPEEIEQKFTQWWEYWREYWRLIDTDRALPEDGACEMTIPAGE